MILRAATLDDLAILTELERQCFPLDPWNEASLQEALSDEKYLILLLETRGDGRSSGKATGFILGWNVGDEGEIARVGVLTALRQQGLGKMLLDAALVEFEKRGVNEVFLEVRAGNVAALRLYESRVFGRVGVRRGYYANGEDAIVMSRKALALPTYLVGVEDDLPPDS